MKPPQYWRQNKDWSKWLGRTGKVVAATTVRVSAPQRAQLTPYSYVIVDFGEEKREFMGAGQEALEIGDTVMCVLRKMAEVSEREVLPYGVKVRKVELESA